MSCTGWESRSRRGRCTPTAQLNPHLLDYKLQTAADAPRIVVAFVESDPGEGTPLGAKGVGEPPVVPPAAAVGNALAQGLGRPPARPADDAGAGLGSDAGSTAFSAPETLADALADVADGDVPVAGGTDLVVAARSGRRPLPDALVSLHCAAREAVRGATAFYLTAMPDDALSEVYGIQPQLQELIAAGSVAGEMPAAWLDDLAVAGDPDEAAEKIRALLDAGSDAVCLWLFPLERGEEILELTAREVLPRL